MDLSRMEQGEFLQAETVIEDIKNIRAHRERVSSLQERILRLRSAMEMGTRQLSDLPRSTDVRDRLAHNIARLDELERRLVGETVRLENAIYQAESAIEALPEAQRNILRLRYVDCLSWQKVSDKSYYGLRHCFKLHDKAMRGLLAKADR